MRKVFIADAHLRDENDANYRRLLRFLDTLPGNTDTLFIVGDLFEFWIGYRTVPFTHYFPVLDKLLELKRSGVRIVFFEGNHDFHMGPFFSETLEAEIHQGPALLEIDGRKLFICHGDEMNTKDYPYRLLRFIFHSRLTRLLTHIVPPSIPCFIADNMGRGSRKKHAHRRLRWDYTAIMRDFARARFSEGCDAVITGHFHIPLLEHSGKNQEKTLLSLGDWITHFSYGEIIDGALALRTYEEEVDRDGSSPKSDR